MKQLLLIPALLCFSIASHAAIKVGVILSATGSAASLGIPEKNTVNLLPDTLGGEPVRYLVLDDASDSTTAVKHARKLIEEDKVDLIIGSSTVPTSIAVSGIANEMTTPQLALAPMAITVDKSPWVFAVPQPTTIMMKAVVNHMKSQGVKTVGYIGFADSWGDMVLNGTTANLEQADLTLVGSERYARNDTSVSGQVLKIMKNKPDAVVLGGTGTPGVLPHLTLRQQGYSGPIYHNTGVINKDFLRVGGDDVENAYAPTGPVIVAEQLPDTNPVKKTALEFIAAYEGKHGTGTRNAFAAYAWDAYLLADKAAAIAAQTATPGTEAFRSALRTALEQNNEVAGTHGIYNMSKTDHTGVDERASVLVQVKDNEWRLVQQ